MYGAHQRPLPLRTRQVKLKHHTNSNLNVHFHHHSSPLLAGSASPIFCHTFQFCASLIQMYPVILTILSTKQASGWLDLFDLPLATTQKCTHTGDKILYIDLLKEIINLFRRAFSPSHKAISSHIACGIITFYGAETSQLPLSKLQLHIYLKPGKNHFFFFYPLIARHLTAISPDVK